MFQLGYRSDVTSSPTQIPLCAVVNIEIACSNACRNARILSIAVIFSLMKSGKLVDFFKRKKNEGVSGTLSKGSAHALSSTSEEMDGNSTSHQGTPEPPVRAQELFQQQAEILEKLKNIPQGGQGRNDSAESPQGPRACYKCGIHNCPHQVRHDQENWRWAGHSQK